jgi:hypothetical protein
MSLLRTSLLVVVLALAGCATAPSMVSDRMFFGRAIPGGGEVTEAQWNAFVAEMILPRFPEGFAIWRGSGHWRGDDGVEVEEPMCVLETWHVPGPAVDAKLDQIARAYRQRFNQDAVILARTKVEETFWRR